MRCTAYKVAPEDELIQSETCKASNRKIKSNHKNFVHLVSLYTYLKGYNNCKCQKCETVSICNFYTFLNILMLA